MYTSRDLTAEENAELQALNDAVTVAIAQRRKWLDRKMHEVSALKVGDGIYDVNSGARLGTVQSLYRFWEDRDEGVRDRSLSFDYTYLRAEGWISNTSSQPGISFGTKEQAKRRLQSKVESMK